MKIRRACRMLNIMLGIFIFLSCLGFSFINSCYAKESEESDLGTTVTYVKTENEKHLLYVSIIGKGSINDGNAVLRKQINKYELEYGAIKTFRILPDKGNELQKVTLDGTDITDKVVDKMLRIKVQDYDQHLKVYFINDNDNGNDNSKSVQTGDKTKLGLGFLGLGASILILYILKKKKDDKDTL